MPLDKRTLGYQEIGDGGRRLHGRAAGIPVGGELSTHGRADCAVGSRGSYDSPHVSRCRELGDRVEDRRVLEWWTLSGTARARASGARPGRCGVALVASVVSARTLQTVGLSNLSGFPQPVF